MKDQDIIIAVAELDSNKDILQFFDRNKGLRWELICTLLPKYNAQYLTSRNAIIPVIGKLDETTQEHICVALCAELKISEHERLIFGAKMICASPRQLCIALLKATNKWKD